MPSDVSEYRIITDAPIDQVACVVGRSWQAGILRSRLGRVEDVGGNAYRMTFFGNSVVVTLAEDGGATRLETAVERSPETYALYPVLDRLLHVDRLSRRVFEDLVCRHLRDSGYEASVQVDTVAAPG